MRKVLLLLDNVLCHGKIEGLPYLLAVRVVFLFKNTASVLQPLDAGTIAAIKSKDKSRQMERAVDFLEDGLRTKLYDIDIKVAISWTYHIWYRINSDTVRNCWAKTRLVH